MIAIYPGSFDPITYGHLDIINRCANKFTKVIVAVLNNQNKSVVFSTEERVSMIKELTSGYDNVQVDNFEGLLIDYAKKMKADVIVRGLRAVSDYEYEMQMSLYNKQLCPEVETMFLVSDTKYSYLSSSIVKEIASYGGEISNFVPSTIEERIKAKYGCK